MNNENLKKGKATQFKSGEQAVKNGRKGGIASGKAKREKADLRRLMAMMLEEKPKGEELTYAQKITLSMLSIASDEKMGGASVRAYQTISHIMGQDEPEPKHDSLDVLKAILEENRKNAKKLYSDEETK